MKKPWIWLGAAALAGLWAVKQMARSSYEQVPYQVREQLDGFEVRAYPPYLTATVTTAGEFETAMNQAFRRLAGYIFGGNEKSQKIAMTTPVEFREQEGEMTMTFMLPSSYRIEDLPRPNDGGVQLTRQSGRLLAALRFSGRADAAVWEAKERELLEMVARSNYQVGGRPLYFGYDPPVVPGPLRRNEVLVEVR